MTVDVLGGTPATGFQVRMTGPSTPTPGPGPGPGPNPGPTHEAQTGGIASKLRMDGRKRINAALTCPVAASSCTGTLTLSLAGLGELAGADYSVAPPGADVALNIGPKERKALGKKFGKRGTAKAKATLAGASGTFTAKVKLVR